MHSPYRWRLSYSFSPNVCGSCNNSNAGKLGVAGPALFALRFYHPSLSICHTIYTPKLPLTLFSSFFTALSIFSFFLPLFPTSILCSNFLTSFLASLIPSPSSSDSSSASLSDPKKKCKAADWTLVFGWKAANATMETVLASFLNDTPLQYAVLMIVCLITDVGSEVGFTHQTPFFHNSRTIITAHIASPPFSLFFPFPLSPTT